MHRLCALFLTLILALVWHAPAKASGDFGCTPTWKLGHRTLSDCDNMAFLAPGNDTRVNLTLLLLDRRKGRAPVPAGRAPDLLFDWRGFGANLSPRPDVAGADSGYADGEGSRCRTNESGAASFAAALAATGNLPEAERADLAKARESLQPGCTGTAGDASLITATAARTKSAAGKAFARYLQGANAFYDGDYDGAAAAFAALRGADQPWLRETARYMLGRVEVNRAQINAFDEYGSPKEPPPVEDKVILAGEAALRGYIHDYPAGLYAASARGLLRRLYWLGGMADKLAAEYAIQFAQDPATRGIDDAALADEIDNKLLPRLKPADARDPILLAVADLLRMRRGDSPAQSDCCGTPITLAELEAQRPAFASDPALFAFLLAAHAFYLDGKPAEVLRLIPDAARQSGFSYLQFSRQMLRGMALDAARDRNARGFWLDMIASAADPWQRPPLELALALHDERDNGLDRVFAAGSPVRSQAIREILLANAADAALLRREARDAAAPRHEREVALFTLLYKEVTRGAYRDFIADLALVPAEAPVDTGFYDLYGTEKPPTGLFVRATNNGDYGCPALRETATRLAADPKLAGARLCLADFMRVNGFDGFMLDAQLPRDELGGAPSRFAGGLFSRLEVYKEIIADPAAPGPDKAYALYRAVNCYGPSGTNSCGGVEVPTATRKAWFSRLKKDYPTSSWAQAQRIFW